MQTNIYKHKYFKYKNKYLDLQNKLNNLSGGKLNLSKNLFFEKILKNHESIYELFRKDEYLMEKLNDKSIELPYFSPDETTLDKLKENKVLNEIFNIIIDGIKEDIMDNYITIYLNGKFGEPNSIKNKTKYIDAQAKIKKLKDNKSFINITIPFNFTSLSHLEDEIKKNETNLDLIDKKNEE